MLPSGSTIATLNAPFTNADGKVGFTGNQNPADNFIWYDTGIIWQNSQGLPGFTITGAEGTMGVSNAGGFIYSPSVNTNDAVWGIDGLILAADAAAPGFAGMFNSFNSRPTMTPFNVAHWVAGISATAGGATQQRVVYRRMADSGQIVSILSGGDTVGGLTISLSGLEFDYDISDNLKHHIHVCDTTAATTSDQIVYLDGAIALREGDSAGPVGDLWQAFDIVSVNDSGNWIVTGDTNGLAATDEFVAYNGSIVAREGDTLDGVVLGSGWALRAASINNLNRVVHMWGLSTNEVLFAGDGPTLATSSVRILGTGDQLDTNGDKVPDASVTDFEASTTISPGLSLSDHDFVFVEVTLTDLATSTAFEAIVRVPLPGTITPCPADIAPAPDGDGQVNVTDLLAVVAGWGPCPPVCDANINGDNEVNVTDLLAIVAAWGGCP